jgi:hypothetical protein
MIGTNLPGWVHNVSLADEGCIGIEIPKPDIDRVKDRAHTHRHDDNDHRSDSACRSPSPATMPWIPWLQVRQR